MSEQPLFKQTDQQEQVVAPQELPRDERVAADERGGQGHDDSGDVPIAVGLGNVGGAAPVSDSFDPGVRREQRDLLDDEQDVVGRDPRDERAH